ncbi:hypothetical protein OAE88_00600 [bacterium]|nr:hypothetical protein [bacterium]
MGKCDIFDRVINFNYARNIAKKFNLKVEYENIKEELQELLDAGSNSSMLVDALCDIIVFCIGALWKLGYTPSLAMEETLKEIESRNQDKEQEKDWFMNGASGKWKKSKSQTNMYTADYNKAKE